MSPRYFTFVFLIPLVLLATGCKKEDEDTIVDPAATAGTFQVTIDSRTESLMIDQISGAKSVSLTSGRSYRLTLASNATPIHDRVCIMYHSTSGLTCDLLTEGSVLQFTAGYTQLFVWLVDWSTTADNTGSATVTITDLSNSSVRTVTIDSRRESILLDGRVEAKFSALTIGKRYTVSVSSNATPIPDRVFMMYQSTENGLSVDVVTEAAPINFTNQYTQCAFFMPDWVTRTDNTGSAIITITPI